MTRFAVGLCCVLGLSWNLSSAHASESPQFAYCKVHDTGGHDIWASPVFEFAMPADGGWAVELQRMATEFHTYVGTLGGSGDKTCHNGLNRHEIEALRADTKTALTKRFMGVRINKWNDVQWTPSPRSAETVAQANAPVTKFIHCRDSHLDSRKLVTTKVFRVTMPPMTSDAYFVESQRIQREFSEYAAATYRGDGGLCVESDTLAEAEKSRADYKKLFRLSGANWIDDSWQPSAQPVAASTARVAPSVAPATAVPSAPGATPTVGSPGSVPTNTHAEIVESIRLQLANEPFFKVPSPENEGTQVRRSGKRMAAGMPISTTIATERFNGENFCRDEIETVAGSGTVVTTAMKSVSWAGFIPLNVTSDVRVGATVSGTSYRVQRIDELVGQPFPLVAGSRFSFRTMGEASVSGKVVDADKLTWSCLVGATGPAETVVPGTPGSQTEMKCNMSFESNVVPPQDFVIHWFSAAGCFAQDPSRP